VKIAIIITTIAMMTKRIQTNIGLIFPSFDKRMVLVVTSKSDIMSKAVGLPLLLNVE